MATAPRPGVSRREKDSKAARRTMTITVGEHDPVTLVVNNLPITEKLILRKATGLPLEAFLGDEDRIGEDSICVLWWLARRANGEIGLTWARAAAEWPDDLTEDQLDVSIDEDLDEAADDPQPSGPSS